MVLIMGIGERLKEAREEQGISLDTLKNRRKYKNDICLLLKKKILIFYLEHFMLAHLLRNMHKLSDLMLMKSSRSMKENYRHRKRRVAHNILESNNLEKTINR